MTDAVLEAARKVRANAYCPYSDYPVGAALLADDGRIYVGCNVENASYGATICAERSAILAMIAAGGRRWVALAVVTRDLGRPCGMCLQVLSEFVADRHEARVVCASETEQMEIPFPHLLPEPFSLSSHPTKEAPRSSE